MNQCRNVLEREQGLCIRMFCPGYSLLTLNFNCLELWQLPTLPGMVSFCDIKSLCVSPSLDYMFDSHYFRTLNTN